MSRKAHIQAWVLVGLLWGVGLLNYLDRQMLATMRPSMSHDIPWLLSATHFGWLMGIFLWVYGLASPLAGLLADRLSRKRLLVASLWVWSAVTFCMSLTRSPELLMGLRGLMGLSEALYLPTALAMIADAHPRNTRSLAIGIHMTGLYLGSALGGFGAWMAAISSWQAAFRWIGGVGLLYSLILIVLLKPPPSTLEGQGDGPRASVQPMWQSLKDLLRRPAFWMILMYFAVPSLPGWAAKNWLPTLFSEHLHMPMREAGPWSTVSIAASSLVGVLVGGVLSDRWIRYALKGRIYTGALGLLLMVPSLILLGFGQSLEALLAAGICFGLGYGMFDANTMPILCQFVPGRQRASAYGILNMAGVFSGAFITDYLGRATDAGHLGQDFAALAILVLAVALLQVLVLRPRSHDFDHLPAPSEGLHP